jgi:hypothetical protein
MKAYFFTEMLVRAFTDITECKAKLLMVHQASGGWVFIIKDEIDGQEYLCNAIPLKIEKIVLPNSVDELLRMQSPKEIKEAD